MENLSQVQVCQAVYMTKYPLCHSCSLSLFLTSQGLSGLHQMLELTEEQTLIFFSPFLPWLMTINIKLNIFSSLVLWLYLGISRCIFLWIWRLSVLSLWIHFFIVIFHFRWLGLNCNIWNTTGGRGTKIKHSYSRVLWTESYGLIFMTDIHRGDGTAHIR